MSGATIGRRAALAQDGAEADVTLGLERRLGDRKLGPERRLAAAVPVRALIIIELRKAACPASGCCRRLCSPASPAACVAQRRPPRDRAQEP
ncbi:hypothetical protein HPB50_018887 [Hyalomma asiaticum]|uniref:Uncharacterized protein n=1 Tax=Hyalomma asiaticum TaxID=266040 RepID=A0ACB7TKT5_HYAAI|nr:hypothetical protein HPB50_018887 [Hyalomma asiaticum]